MTKQELAESMAKFLGIELLMKHTGDSKRFISYSPGTIKSFDIGALEETIFSPDGFFAVWDKLDQSIDYQTSFMQTFIYLMYREKKDRYTALYSAIHEMRKKK